ncbi:MAG TPA: RIO1 family regulatory kinase/ATPase [Actinomycetota bacterium]|nr:RIO1 family regulatory kinase/ATPase [Actinomycetota bacterium]
MRKLVDGEETTSGLVEPIDHVDMEAVKRRRAFVYGTDDDESAAAPRSRLSSLVEDEYVPEWLPTEDYIDEEIGHIKSGKEGDVALVERRSPTKSCLLAWKRIRSRSQRAFKNDQIYREGIRFRYARDARAIERGTAYGWNLVNKAWFFSEFEALQRVYAAGCSVPYPVEGDASLLMEYIGDEEQAAPRLIDARLTKDEAHESFDSIMADIKRMALEGIVHCDLSPYNILFWKGRTVIIDFPQAVDIAGNPHAIEFLERDIDNVARYFRKFGVECDPGAELAEILADLFVT